MADATISGTVLTAVTDYGPQMALIGGAGVIAGGALFGVKRGWAFFRSLAGR